MSWFRRQASRGSDQSGEAGVATELAEFLKQATEGKALMQAVGDAHTHPDEPAMTPTDNDVPRNGADDEGRPEL
jgi:hypothetical protein